MIPDMFCVGVIRAASKMSTGVDPDSNEVDAAWLRLQSEMSTEVDTQWIMTDLHIEAVSEMSTSVDSVPTVDVPQIEAVSEMSTDVDKY